MAAAIDVDALVARYAPLGRRQRRQRRLRRLYAVIVSGVIVGLVALLATGSGMPRWAAVPSPAASANASTVSPYVREIEKLRGRLDTADAALESGREAWEAQRQSLLAQVAELRARQDELEQQREAVMARQAALEDPASNAGRQVRLEAEWQAEREARLATEIAALTAEKRRLEAERREFEAQRELVARELDALRAQRTELGRQQQALERQREEFQALMSRLEASSRVSPADDAAVDADADAGAADGGAAGADAPLAEGATGVDLQLLADLPPVADETLGGMRGAYRAPGGYDISFGLTRSASINGVEQFSNTVTVDGIHGLGSGGGQSTLIQIGDGNVVGAAMMDALAAGMGTVIQNSVDQQLIQTKTVIDISLQDVSNAVNGLTLDQAIGQSLSLQR